MLFIYVFALLKPLTPILSDFLAHTFWQQDHITSVHFENGKYHMHVELAKEIKEQAPQDTKTTNTSSSDFLSFHTTQTSIRIDAFYTYVLKTYYSGRSNPISIMVKPLTPPPQA